MDDLGASERWALLLYTVPAAPSRKRAAVWREVRRLGALYLRDGACALPDTASARAGLAALAARVAELAGQATLVYEARLSPPTAAGLRAELARARQAEYDEVTAAAAALLRHVGREAEHRAFRRAELAGLASDLGRLERWLAQIRARDYLHDGDAAAVTAALAACRAALEEQAAGAA
jgi:hypothetical protein